MKTLILTLSVLFVLPSFAHAKCGANIVEITQKALELAQAAYEGGAASQSAVTQAELSNLAAQECAGQISNAQYCAAAQPKLEQELKTAQRRAEAGMGSVSDMAPLVTQAIELGRICQ